MTYTLFVAIYIYICMCFGQECNTTNHETENKQPTKTTTPMMHIESESRKSHAGAQLFRMTAAIHSPRTPPPLLPPYTQYLPGRYEPSAHPPFSQPYHCTYVLSHSSFAAFALLISLPLRPFPLSLSDEQTSQGRPMPAFDIAKREPTWNSLNSSRH